MEEKGSLRSSNLNYRQLTSSFLNTPRLFTGFVSKGSAETDSVMGSPTSILDTKQFSAALKNPFYSDKTPPKTKIWDSKGLVDALTDEKSDSDSSKFERRMVLFGSQLKILQVPSPTQNKSVLPPYESPKSPCDFGIKTRHSHVSSSPLSPRLLSHSLRKSMFGCSSLSASEMELSEDYTRVISHGPNPVTKHIFDDCIVESCSGVVMKLSESESRKENKSFPLTNNRAVSYPSDSFLSFCYTCKKQLERGKDIYMYRGDKAFCSSDCRDKEMMLDEDELEIEFLLDN